MTVHETKLTTRIGLIEESSFLFACFLIFLAMRKAKVEPKNAAICNQDFIFEIRMLKSLYLAGQIEEIMKLREFFDDTEISNVVILLSKKSTSTVYITPRKSTVFVLLYNDSGMQVGSENHGH